MLPIYHGSEATLCTSFKLFERHDVTDSPRLIDINVVNGSFAYNHSFTTSVGLTNMTDLFTNVTGRSSEKIPLSSTIILIVLYTLTTLAAVVGNSLAIIVFAKGRRSNTDLRHFLLNLAVADLIMAIFCIPFTLAYQIADNWIFSSFMCPVVQGCQVVSVTASVSTNTAIGIDRLIAVKCPLHSRVTDSRSKLCILSIWMFAISLGTIPFIMSRTIQKRDGKISCEEHFLDEDIRVMYGFFITIITYFLPVTILSVTYIMIGKLLWRHKVPGNADDHRDAVQLKSKRKVVKMLITIVLLFGLCWLPLHLFITVTLTFKQNVFGDLAYNIYFAVHWLSMANSFVNPLIYGFMNDNFKADLKSLVESYGICKTGRRRLKYRPAAVRRRLGGANVHDFSPSSLRSLKWQLDDHKHQQISHVTPDNYNQKTSVTRTEVVHHTPTQHRICRKSPANTVPIL